MQTRLNTGNLRTKPIFDLSATPQVNLTHTCYTQAAKHQSWRSAMLVKFLTLKKQGTWSLVPAPTNQSILGYHWTYKIKLKPDGWIRRYKACPVAQGFNQEYGIDYKETFSPVKKNTYH
ncbi:hypothetical protein KFK09_021299 [Dendrobium nobile]|uniref:Reverse transcriptase Ty1/copia-type domain-containing protein n=1 Tax=Dendrobium nobile TaxID=94219 RepID=A0A8T3APS2_DENNO|nr:hypothetical protein KFK09_021299 [Dendrobium nobile]